MTDRYRARASIVWIALLVSVPARADEVVDLRVRDEPKRPVTALHMRAVDEAADVATATASTDAAAEVELTGGYTAIPTTWRDVQERVIFKVNVGYELDDGPASGDIHKGGVAPGDVRTGDGEALEETRQYLLGDAVFGSRGVLMPSLNTYFLSQYAIAAEGDTSFATLNSVYDQEGGRALLVHAGYAELDGWGEQGPLSKVFVRAGRQFRYGASMFVTNFDGVSAGYDDRGYEVTGFVGRRVSLYFEDDPGVLGGGGVTLRGQDLVGVPVDVALDYLNFEGDRQYIELSGRYKHQPTGLKLYLLSRVVDNGDLAEEQGMGLGRVGLRARYPVSRRILVTGDVEYVTAHEVAYDFLAPSRADVVDVVDAGQAAALGFDPPQDALRVGAMVMAMLGRDVEAFAFGRANLPSDESQSAFDTPYEELGVAAQAGLGRALRINGQYKLRVHQLSDGGAGDPFFDASSAGVSQFHELACELRYSLGYRKATATAGAYVRVYDFQTPYAEVDNDSRAGGRLDFDYWLSRALRVKAAGEVAQPSPTFFSDVGMLASVRVLMEAAF